MTEELTKCYEPLQKPCKTDFSPPVILYCGSFQCDTSVVVLFVLCLGVKTFLCCWRLMYVFISLV